MADWKDTQRTTQGFGSVPRAGGDVASRASYDEGLRSYMLSIYNYMASGVLLTGIVAILFSWGGNESAVAWLYMNGGPLLWIIKLAPLGFILAMSFGLHKMSQTTLQIVFWAFATVMGMSMSTIFLVYTGESIATTFFATAAAFAGLSLFGYTTKKDLSGFGSFLIMGVIGLIVAMIVNWFLQSEAMAFVISGLGVLIFAGLTAYDTQRLKNDYQYLRGTEFMGKAVIMGATSLYLDFVNMFMFLLQFLGSRE
ncbi:integral membrane protein [Erythrobacter sp. NAP1]|uniref:Bax inhibitor-1/YccA family protein n=1 Tax=Erythrobacter sp. NAP1 TaxID=237727 RepID=UPI0000686A18|nr:Bax inhibitor-1/YccA family protein [Erythrobacter sp. NAP1]EAQ29313.1 integral membrane protein [Erythrobacter sp. NAP1]